MRILYISLLVVLLISCATENPPRESGIDDLVVGLLWPALPAQTRIRYLSMYEGPDDLGLKLPLSARMRNFVGGAEATRMTRPYAIAVSRELIAVTDPGAGFAA